MNTENKNTEGFKITGDWAAHSEQLKTKFTDLTAEDLQFEPGKELELVTRISSRLKKGREEVIHLIKKSNPEKAAGIKVEPEAAGPKETEVPPVN